MKKDELINYIRDIYLSNRMFESIMFESNNQKELNDLVMNLTRFIYCDNNNLEKDGCSSCLKSDVNQILDLTILGDGVLPISKNEIQELISKMSTSAVEIGKPKIAIIKNAENLKKEASNSLLKFLEEPTHNTYFFLLTNDRNQVLPTIKSRSKFIPLNIDNENVKENYIVNIIRSKDKNNILLMNNKMKKKAKEELILDLQEAKNNFLNINEMKIYELILTLIDDIKFNNNINLAIDAFLINVIGE